jgi:hypothetical protein
VALKYKQPWTVKAIFRTMKRQLDTRPIFYKTDDTVRGHVFYGFLALLLREALHDRLEAQGPRPSRTRAGPHPRRPGRLAGDRADLAGQGLPAAHRDQGDALHGVRRRWRRAAPDAATDVIVTVAVAPAARSRS